MEKQRTPAADDDCSCSAVNVRFVQAWQQSRPRPKGVEFPSLVEQLGDPMLAEIIWIFYGRDSFRVINAPLKALGGSNSWWRFWQKDTILSLVSTSEGKRKIWQMLHDASAWM